MYYVIARDGGNQKIFRFDGKPKLQAGKPITDKMLDNCVEVIDYDLSQVFAEFQVPSLTADEIAARLEDEMLQYPYPTGMRYMVARAFVRWQMSEYFSTEMHVSANLFEALDKAFRASGTDIDSFKAAAISEMENILGEVPNLLLVQQINLYEPKKVQIDIEI